MAIKFENIDRQHVVDALQDRIGLKLSHVVGKRKRDIYWEDEAGKKYVVLGCVGDWHGMPDDVIEDIEESHPDSNLAIALMTHNTLKIYLGDIEPFIKALDQLKRVGDKYTFHVDEYGDLLTVREAQSVKLDLLTEVPYSESDRIRAKNNAKIKKLLENMSQSEKEEFIRKAKKS